MKRLWILCLLLCLFGCNRFKTIEINKIGNNEAIVVNKEILNSPTGPGYELIVWVKIGEELYRIITPTPEEDLDLYSSVNIGDTLNYRRQYK